MPKPYTLSKVKNPSKNQPKPDVVKKKTVGFNGMSPREWTMLSKNIWDDLSSPRNKRHIEHGAVYPMKLAERMVSLFSAPGDLVFDPFNGIGTTIIAAHKHGRKGVGIELNPRFVELTNDWMTEEFELMGTATTGKPIVHHDDCRNLKKYLEPDSVQLTFTSPPYADFIQRSVKDRAKTHKKSALVIDNNSQVKQYSTNPADFGNISYDDFLLECKTLFKEILDVTKPGGFTAWVVKDYRMPPDRPYVSMHSDLAHVGQQAGWLWHDLIIWNQNEQRRLVLLGYPRRFYTNQNCSFIVVFRKNG